MRWGINALLWRRINIQHDQLQLVPLSPASQGLWTTSYLVNSAYSYCLIEDFCCDILAKMAQSTPAADPVAAVASASDSMPPPEDHIQVPHALEIDPNVWAAVIISVRSH